MSDNNQAYSKRCGECGTIALKLFITKVSDGGGKKIYRMLCESCSRRYG